MSNAIEESDDARTAAGDAELAVRRVDARGGGHGDAEVVGTGHVGVGVGLEQPNHKKGVGVQSSFDCSPTRIAHTIALLLHDCCAIQYPPPTPTVCHTPYNIGDGNTLVLVYQREAKKRGEEEGWGGQRRRGRSCRLRWYRCLA